MDAEAADVVLHGAKQADGSFYVHDVLKGASLIHADTVGHVSIVRSSQPYLLFGKTTRTGHSEWTRATPASNVVLEFLSRAMGAAESGPQRLHVFWPYLWSSDSSVADDAYYQFAKENYQQIKAFASHVDRQQVIAAIEQPGLLPHFRLLMLKLLGACGEPSDAEIPWQILTSSDVRQLRGLETVIASYLSLAGHEGLERLTQVLLRDRDTDYAVTFAAIQAIGFQLTEEEKIPRVELLKALHSLLDNQEIADVVLADLAEWDDWTAVDKANELFRRAAPDRPWLRVAAAKYLIACPEPEAKKALAELRKVDSAAIRLAETGRDAPARIHPGWPGKISGARIFLWLTSPWGIVSLATAVLGSASIVTLRRRIRNRRHCTGAVYDLSDGSASPLPSERM
jgi:hypothetical protein